MTATTHVQRVFLEGHEIELHAHHAEWLAKYGPMIAAAPELLEALRKLEVRSSYYQQAVAAQATELETRGDFLAEGHRRFSDEFLAEMLEARAAIARATPTHPLSREVQS